MKLHGTATDKLADVIQVLQLVHKTGLLTAQRDGINDSLEQGTVTFRDGQVIDASVGSLRGNDAFKKLLSWTTCHFIFQPSSPKAMLPPPATIKDDRPSPDRVYQQESSNGHILVSAIPRRVWLTNGALPDFQRLGLSRMHRQLFLLIDGKRSVQELMRLMARRPNEILALLIELEAANLIHV
jgi:Domain of unknown function (DUF4388)